MQSKGVVGKRGVDRPLTNSDFDAVVESLARLGETHQTWQRDAASALEVFVGHTPAVVRASGGAFRTSRPSSPQKSGIVGHIAFTARTRRRSSAWFAARPPFIVWS